MLPTRVPVHLISDMDVVKQKSSTSKMSGCWADDLRDKGLRRYSSLLGAEKAGLGKGEEVQTLSEDIS